MLQAKIFLWSEGAITRRDCQEMTLDEQFDWYIRLGEAQGLIFNYEKRIFEGRRDD